MTYNIHMDRRKFPRYNFKVHTQITTPEFYITVNTIEISVEGIRAKAYSEIKPRTEVTISFDLKRELFFYGKVIWVIAFQRKDILKYMMEIKINEIVLSGAKVTGFNDKDELIQDILTEFKKSE